MRKICLYSLLALLVFSTQLYATHIVGGELYYTCIGNNKYVVTLKLYRDCFNGQAPYDNPAPIGVYKSNGTLVQLLELDFPGSNLIPPTTISPCLVPPADVCVEVAIYQDTITLPPMAGGYDLVYQRCCRNGTISNINNPGDAGATYWAHIPDASVVPCNSSPRFDNFPPLFLCANVPFNFNHVATDPDNDVLVYSFCDPYDGGSMGTPAPNPPDPPPFAFVGFAPGYSASYPIDANPAFSINSSSGYLTGTPTNIGQYVVGICVSEYRNGQLISVNKRDFQFNILFCDAAIAAIPAQTQFCNGYDVDFTGSASINSTTYFWDFGDPSTLADTSTNINTSYTYQDSGVYNITLIAYDPVGNCYDTNITAYYIYPLLEPSFNVPATQCLTGNSFDFVAGGDFTSDAVFDWNFGPNSNANAIDNASLNPTDINFNAIGTTNVSLTISQYGCSETYTNSINIVDPPNTSIGTVNQYCVGYTIDFQNTTPNATVYQWNFGDPTTSFDVSNLFEPSYTYPDSGIYTVTLIAINEGVCADTATVNFWVYPMLYPQILGSEPQCTDHNSFNFEAAGAYTTDATFNWDFTALANPISSVLEQPTGVVFPATAAYPISLTISQYGCVKSAFDTVHLYNSPQANFTIDGAQGCPPLTIQFTNLSTSDTPLIYHWNLGDNSSSNLSNPIHNYIDSGTFSIYLEIFSLSGCTDTAYFSLLNAVNVIPYPIPGLSADAYEANIFEPMITFFDSSKLATGCQLRLSDGTLVNTCNYAHTFTDTGYFNVTQIVRNEFNCVDSVTISVYISPAVRIFVPNAFSPNDDNLNDTFKPTLIGVKHYHFSIFNRWGEEIFKTENTDVGWNGMYYNSKAPVGVYVYVIRYTDVKGTEKSFNGKVVLVR